MSYNNEQVCVGPCEDRDVHGDVQSEWLVQTHTEVPLPAQKQQDEHADVHEAHTSCKHTYKKTDYSGW